MLRLARLSRASLPRISREKHTRAMADLPLNKTAHPFDKVRFEALLNRRFFYAPAFEIYGGTPRPPHSIFVH